MPQGRLRTDPDEATGPADVFPRAAERSSPHEENSARTLLNRDFVLLWQGQFVSQIGKQAFQVAMMFWLMEATGSATLMGLITMLSSLPGLIVGPIGGTFADRHSRKAILLASNLMRGVSVLGLAGLLVWRPESPGLLVAAFFFVSIFGGVMYAFFMPALTAAIPNLVPRSRLATANSLHQFSSQGALSLGQAAGGVLFGLLGAPVLLIVNGLGYLYAALCTLLVKIPQSLPKKERKTGQVFTGYMADTREGMRYVWRNPGMRDFLLTVAALNFFFMPVFVLLPFYVDGFLGAQAGAYGFLLALFGLGGLAGYALAGWLDLKGRGRGPLMVGSLIGTSVLFGAVGLVRELPLALACFFGIGLFTGLVNVLSTTVFQLSSPGEMRGRVMGLVLALSRAASPIGMGLGGLMGDLMGRNIPLIYGLCGGAPLLLCLLVSLRKPFREFIAWDGTRPVVPEASA
jgi:DHA3 family macrolide efflux protein-like MFS transporter